MCILYVYTQSYERTQEFYFEKFEFPLLRVSEKESPALAQPAPESALFLDMIAHVALGNPIRGLLSCSHSTICITIYFLLKVSRCPNR